MQKGVRLVIKGRVQGVFFRQSARDVARSIGLTGQVANQDDGSVEAIAWGPDYKLELFIDWCKRGPERARVDAVEEEWLAGASPFSDFDVKRD